MGEQDDPLGYYAALGVAPNAPASVIRAAFRALAMELHPDRNKAADATKHFQTIQRAFDVLSDQTRRAEYDASTRSAQTSERRAESGGAARAPDREQESRGRYEPLRCTRCGSISASPRYRIFFWIFSYVVGASRTPVQGRFCARCEMIEGTKCTAATLLLGWWSIHGFFWTLQALYYNLLGARSLLEENVKLLAHQAGYFLSVGNRPLALAVAGEAYAASLKLRIPTSKIGRVRANLGYPPQDPLATLRDQLRRFIETENGGEVPKLRHGLRGLGPAFYVQSALVFLFAGALGTWWAVEQERAARTEEARLVKEGLQRARAAAIAREQEAVLAANLLPLPISGEYRRLGPPSHRNLPPLKVKASRGANFFIHVNDASSDRTVLWLFVRSGDEVAVRLVPGTYRIKFASGENWYGEKIRFGPSTAYSMIKEPMTFTVTGRQLLGHEIILDLVPHGNLRREPISATEF